MSDKNLPPHPRTVKSFAIRAGRMSARQEQALETAENTYLLPNNAPANWKTVFMRTAPVTLEIGFGMGHSLLQNALTEPDRDFVGIEVFRRGIGALLAEVDAQKICNLCVFHGDAVDILKHAIPNNSLDTVQIFFPDPWPKRRHHKRRLIQPTFINLLLDKLKTGGYLHLATDWEDYALHMMRTLSTNTALTNTAGIGKFSTERRGRLPTKYEQRGHRLGHCVYDLWFVKN